MSESFRERVRQGAKFLDEYQPDWAPKIDKSRLDLSRDNECVIGQLYGSYDYAIETIFVGEESVYEEGLKRGFVAPCMTKEEERLKAARYRLLTRYWIEEIDERLQKEAT